MAKDESKLVEEVVETTETTEVKEKFNPLAFTEDAPTGELGPDIPVNDDEKEHPPKPQPPLYSGPGSGTTPSKVGPRPPRLTLRL